MDRPGLEAALPDLDVLVIDDIMRTFSVYDISRAQSFGVHVIAVVDQSKSATHEHVDSLGADQVLGCNLPPGELLAAVLESASDGRDLSAPRRALNGLAWAPRMEGQKSTRKGSGWVCAWTRASGGAGLTEAVVAGALELSKRYRVLLVEAEEVAPVLVSRLARSPEGGLPWALSRAGQGLSALPEGLSRLRPGEPSARDCFDVVCAAPSAAHEINAAQLDRFLAEASTLYDYVLVETSWLLGASSGRERFSAARAVLRGAACIVVMATADPEGAGRLVQWKAAALGSSVGAPAFAAFGRCGASKYEREHLRSIVEANTGRHPFAGFAFLPLDPRVARARWNGELVRKGPFVESVGMLAAKTAAVAASSENAERRDRLKVRTA